MSSHAIAAERAAFGHRDPIFVPDKGRVCSVSSTKGRGYCGRTSATTRSSSWPEVNCTDCRAAARADGVKITLLPGGKS